MATLILDYRAKDTGRGGKLSRLKAAYSSFVITGTLEYLSYSCFLDEFSELSLILNHC